MAPPAIHIVCEALAVQQPRLASADRGDDHMACGVRFVLITIAAGDGHLLPPAGDGKALLVGDGLQVLSFAGPAAVVRSVALLFHAGLSVEGPDVNNGERKFSSVPAAHSLLQLFSQMGVKTDR